MQGLFFVSPARINPSSTTVEFGVGCKFALARQPDPAQHQVLTIVDPLCWSGGVPDA